MNWKDHVRIVQFVRDNLSLKFSPSMDKALRYGSIKPDKLRKANPELHKGSESAFKAILEARQEYVAHNLDNSAEWLGIALHNIADEINITILDSRIDWGEWIDHKDWEEGISRSLMPERCDIKIRRLEQIRDYVFCTWSHSGHFTRADIDQLKPLIERHPLNDNMEYSVSLELEGETRQLFRVRREPSIAVSYIAQVSCAIAEVIYLPRNEYTFRASELALFPSHA